MVNAGFDTHACWVAAILLAAMAVICWPAPAAGLRLSRLLGAATGRGDGLGGWLRRLTAGEPVRVGAVIVASVLFGGLLAGVGGMAAAAMVGGLAYYRWRWSARRRDTDAEVAALLDAVGVMAAELRAGAHPAGAAAVAANGAAVVHRVLGSVAVGARLGAQVPAMLERHAMGEPAISGELRRMAGAWSLAERHGVALAELMDAVRADLDVRVRLAGQVKALLAGPRATAAVLAVLPLLGIGLGQGIGANPWHVLTVTSAGQLLLVLGTGLTCAGVLWSGRIMAKASPR